LASSSRLSMYPSQPPHKHPHHPFSPRAGTAQQYACQWQNISDALLDDNAHHVVSAALGSITVLLTASLGVACRWGFISQCRSRKAGRKLTFTLGGRVYGATLVQALYVARKQYGSL
jgi:hypothetical protein